MSLLKKIWCLRDAPSKGGKNQFTTTSGLPPPPHLRIHCILNHVLDEKNLKKIIYILAIMIF